jgi:hypothetical protein
MATTWEMKQAVDVLGLNFCVQGAQGEAGAPTNEDLGRRCEVLPESQDYGQFLSSTFALMVEAQGHALHVAHTIADEFFLKPYGSPSAIP